MSSNVEDYSLQYSLIRINISSNLGRNMKFISPDVSKCEKCSQETSFMVLTKCSHSPILTHIYDLVALPSAPWLYYAVHQLCLYISTICWLSMFVLLMDEGDGCQCIIKIFTTMPTINLFSTMATVRLL